MATLIVRLFGVFDLATNAGSFPAFATRKARDLFALLVLHGHRLVPRGHLANEFWPNVGELQARRSLNTELWRIGRTLRSGGMEVDQILRATPEAIGVRDDAPLWSDVGRFEAAAALLPADPQADLDEQGLALLAEALAEYRGDLLEGVYDDWCLVRRESLRGHLVAMLEFLLRRHMRRQEWEAAIGCAMRLLSHDPLLEHVHRALIRCHYLMGNRAAALRQYAACEKLLRDELDVAPMEETLRLYRTMLGAAPKPDAAWRLSAAAPPPPRTAESRSPLQQVEVALANLYTAQGWLEAASRQMRARSDSSSDKK
jgi:DNA-binding SARP family transcriptional activator